MIKEPGFPQTRKIGRIQFARTEDVIAFLMPQADETTDAAA